MKDLDSSFEDVIYFVKNIGKFQGHNIYMCVLINMLVSNQLQLQ